MAKSIRSSLAIAAFIAVAATIVIGAYGLGRTGLLSSTQSSKLGAQETSLSKFPPIRFGDRLSPGALAAISAQAGGAWHRAMILVVAHRIQDAHAQTAYLKVLSERYRDARLTTVCLTTPTFAVASRGLCQPWSGSSIDWRELGAGRETLLVANSEGRVEFVAPGVPPADTIRQVAEKVTTGVVEYASVDAFGLPTFVRGGSVPDVKVTRAGSTDVGRLPDIARPGSTIIYFGASCSACNIRGFAGPLTKFVRAGTPHAVVIVFATPADDPQVRETLAAAGLSAFPVVEVHSVSTAYATRFATFQGETGPLVVTVDDAGRISSVVDIGSTGE